MRTLKAFLLSLLLYLFIFLLLFISFKDLKIPEPQSQSKTISLNLKTMVTPASKPVPQPVVREVVSTPTLVPEPVAKPVPKTVKEEKPVITKKQIPQIVQKGEEHNTSKLVEHKPKVTPKQTPKKPVKAMAKPKPPVKPVRSKDPLANMLMSSGSSVAPVPKEKSFADKMVSQIYGKEFHSYSKEQQTFIKQKLGDIYRITQNTLWRKGYPDIALRMQMQGTNIVSFYLHPNGDISELYLKSHIGYEALDDNTLEVIKIAYKDYPRPQKKTKIMFYVKYILY